MGSLARQSSFNFVLTNAGLLLGFLNVAILYPRVLPDDEFGLTRLLVSIATVAAAFAQLGLDNAVVRYFPYFRNERRGDSGLLTLVLSVALSGALFSMLVLGIGHGWLSGVFGAADGLYATHGLWVLPLVLAEVVFLVLRGYSRSLKRTVYPTFLREFLLRAMQTGLIGAQALWGMHFGLFLALFTATFLAATLLLIADLWRSGVRLTPWRQVKAPKRLRVSMARFSAYTLATSLASVVLGSVDQLMIGALLGTEALVQVAYYAVAFNFGSVVAMPMRALSQLAIPMVADAWKRRDVQAIQRIYRRSSSSQFSIGAALFLLVWVNLTDLFTFLQPQYAVAYDTVLIVSVASLFNMSVGLNAGIISMSRNYRMDSISSGVMLLLNVVFNWVFIQRMGIVGAAWSTLAAMVIVHGWKLWFLWDRYKLWPFTWRSAGVPILLVGIALPLLWLPLTGKPIWDMALRAAIAMAVYWPVVHLLRVAPEVTGPVVQRILRA